eukprot:gene13279-biopygen16555
MSDQSARIKRTELWADHQLAPHHSSGLVSPFRSRTGISHACLGRTRTFTHGLIRIGTLQRRP